MCKERYRDLEEVFEAFDDIRPEKRTTSQAIERVHKAILDHFERTISSTKSSWNIRTRRSILAAAVAVVIMVSLVLSGVLSPFVTTGFAQVREQMDRVRSITFDVKLEVPGTPTVVLRQMLRSDGRSRKQYSDGSYVVVERTQQSWTRLAVNPTERTAHFTYGISLESPLDLFDSFYDLPGSFGANRIESRMVDGRSCPGFLVVREDDRHNQQMRLWVHPDSRLPSYAVVTASVSNGNKGSKAKATLSSFEYDRELEDSLFALVPPDGYNVIWTGRPPRQRSVPWPAERLVLSVGEGIGPVKFGMSREQVIDRFGEPEQRSGPRKPTDGSDRTVERWSYLSQGLSIRFMDPPGGVDLVEGKQETPTSRAFKGMTKEGIGLGSSPEDVRRAYPDILEEQPINEEGFGLYVYPDLRLMVGFVNGVVYNLSIRQVPNALPDSGSTGGKVFDESRQ